MKRAMGNLYRYCGDNPVLGTDPDGNEPLKPYKPDCKKQKICAAIKNAKSLKDFADKYDPTWKGSDCGALLNLTGVDSVYGPIDVDWMITLLAAYYGRAPGLGGWLLWGRSPGTIYGIGKPLWMCKNAATDPKVDFDLGMFGQEGRVERHSGGNGLAHGKDLPGRNISSVTA